MMFPIRKSARKLTGIVKITIPEVFPEMKSLGDFIIFLVRILVAPTILNTTNQQLTFSCLLQIAR